MTFLGNFGLNASSQLNVAGNCSIYAPLKQNASPGAITLPFFTPVVTQPAVVVPTVVVAQQPTYANNATSEKDEAIKGYLGVGSSNLAAYESALLKKAYVEQLISTMGDNSLTRMMLQQAEDELQAEIARLKSGATDEEKERLGGSWYSMNGIEDEGYMNAISNSKGALGGADSKSLYSQYLQNKNFYKEKYGNQAGPGGTAEDMVALAQSFIGKVNSDAEGNKLFSGGKSQAWCADFVREMAKATYGIDFGGTAAVSGIRDWGIKNNCYHEARNYKPKVGDLVIEKNGKSHVSIVAKVYPDGSYDTVEGNHGNKVGSRHVKPGTKTVSGFVSLSEYQYYHGKSSKK